MYTKVWSKIYFWNMFFSKDTINWSKVDIYDVTKDFYFKQMLFF